MTKKFLITVLLLLLGQGAVDAGCQDGKCSHHTQPIYYNFSTGEIAGNTSATQCPDIPGKYCMFQAVKGNAGNVYIGKSGVTKPDGSTDTTTGWELGSGETTPWLPCENLNQFYYITDNSGDDTIYYVSN